MFFSPCLFVVADSVRKLMANVFFHIFVCVHEPVRTNLSLRTLSSPIPGLRCLLKVSNDVTVFFRLPLLAGNFPSGMSDVMRLVQTKVHRVYGPWFKLINYLPFPDFHTRLLGLCVRMTFHTFDVIRLTSLALDLSCRA